MTQYDAVFLAVAVAVLVGPVPRRWAMAFAPAIAWVCGNLTQAAVGVPLAAGAIWLFAPAAAPIGLILAIPSYGEAEGVLRATLLWPAATVLAESLGDRLPAGDDVSARFRGVPLSLAACAILYFALQPLAYIFR